MRGREPYLNGSELPDNFPRSKEMLLRGAGQENGQGTKRTARNILPLLIVPARKYF